MKNSKILIALALLISASQLTFSQEKNDFKLGIKGGVNFSNINTSNTSENKALTGVNFGLFTKLPITRSFAIQPEIYFTTKGSELTYQNVFVDGTAQFDLNYSAFGIPTIHGLLNACYFTLVSSFYLLYRTTKDKHYLKKVWSKQIN